MPKEEDSIRNDSCYSIGANIRKYRLEKRMSQVELVRQVQLNGVSLTRESLVKIESGIQHIKVSQLRAIKAVLKVSYDKLIDG